MKNPRAFAEAASFALFKKLLPFGFLLATLALSVPLFILWKKYQIEALHTLGCIVFLIGLLASFFTAREIVFRMEEDQSLLFSDALAHTLYRYLTFLCFLPIVGPMLQRFLERKRAKNPFTSNDE